MPARFSTCRSANDGTGRGARPGHSRPAWLSGQRETRVRLIDPDQITRRERYQLLTSIVVPRPIGWVSTWGSERKGNLAPFSFFNALSASPMLVGLSVGRRRGRPKDTLTNIREHGAFCVNVVSEGLLQAMNRTSAEVGPDVDEFELAGLGRGESDRVDAPFVTESPAVLECEANQEVALVGSASVLVVGVVVGVRMSAALPLEDGTLTVSPDALRPVGRLSGPKYMLPGDIRAIARP